MTTPKSEEDGTLREWAPLSKLLGQIPLNYRRGLFFEDVKLTCVDAIRECIVVGTNVGLIFWYDRNSHAVQKLAPEKSNYTITAVKIVSTVDYMVAAGDSSGVISIFKIPKPLPDWLLTEIPSNSESPTERYTVGCLHTSPITALEWSLNGQKLFSGDSNGQVVFTEIDFFLNLTKARPILHENHSIVQLSYSQHLCVLVIATVHRCVVCHKHQNEWRVTQIGQKERSSFLELGGFIYVDEEDSVPIVLSCRPGLRLWLADIHGSVQKTIIFKDALRECDRKVVLLSEREECETTVQPELGRLVPLGQGFLVSYTNQLLVVLDPKGVSVRAILPLARITYACSTSTELFVISSDRDLMRLSFVPDPYDSSLGGVGNVATGETVSSLPSFNILPITGTVLEAFTSKSQVNSPCEVMYGQDTALLPPIVPVQEGVAELRLEPSQQHVFSSVGKQQFDEIIYRKKPNKNKKWRRSYEVQKSKTSLDRKMWASMNASDSLSSSRTSMDESMVDRGLEVPAEIFTDLTNLDQIIQDVRDSQLRESNSQENQDPDIRISCVADSGNEENTPNITVAQINKCPRKENRLLESIPPELKEEFLNNNIILSETSYEEEREYDTGVGMGEPLTDDFNLHQASEETDLSETRKHMIEEVDLGCSGNEVLGKEDPEENDSLINHQENPVDISESDKINLEVEGAECKSNIELECNQELELETKDLSSVLFESVENLPLHNFGEAVLKSTSVTCKPRVSECEELSDYFIIRREISEESQRIIHPWMNFLRDVGDGWKALDCPEYGISLSANEDGIIMCTPSLNVYRLSDLEWDLMNYNAEIVALSPSSSVVCRVRLGMAQYMTHSTSKWVLLGREVEHISVFEQDIWYITRGELFHMSGSSQIATKVPTPWTLSKIYTHANVVVGITNNGALVRLENGKWRQIRMAGCHLARLLTMGPNKLVWLVDEASNLYVSDDLCNGQPTWWQVAIGKGPIMNITSLCTTDDSLLLCDSVKHVIYIYRGLIKGHRWEPLRTELRCHQVTAEGLQEDKGSLWVLDMYNYVYSVTPASGISKIVPGIDWSSVCMAGTPQTLWLLTEEGIIYIRKEITDSNPIGRLWIKLNLEQISDDMQLVHISCGYDVVWGCDIRGNVLMMVGSPHNITHEDTFSPAWVTVDGSPLHNNTFTKVYVGPDFHMVWALDSAGNIYVREGIFVDYMLGIGWVLVEGIKASHLSISCETVWALSKKGIFKRVGITQTNYIGDDWILIPGNFDHISVSANEQLWAVETGTSTIVSHCDKAFTITNGSYTDNDWTFV